MNYRTIVAAFILSFALPSYGADARFDGSTDASWEASAEALMSDLSEEKKEALFAALMKLGSLRVSEELQKPVTERKDLPTRMREASDGKTASEVLAEANSQPGLLDKLTAAPANASLEEVFAAKITAESPVNTPEATINYILASLFRADKASFEKNAVMTRTEFDDMVKTSLKEAPEEVRAEVLGELEGIYSDYYEDLLSSWDNAQRKLEKWNANPSNTRIAKIDLEPSRRPENGPSATVLLEVAGKRRSMEIGPFQTTESGKSLPVDSFRIR